MTAPTKRTHPGIIVHRVVVERTIHYGIPTTTPARTLLDLADVLDPPSLTRAVNEARLRHLVRDAALAETIERSPGRRTSFLRAPATPTRSVFEDAFLSFCGRHDLPRPEVNARVHGYEVDMLWRPQRLIAELDGRAYHGHTFEEDRERDAHLLAHGLRTVRITWNRLTTREATRIRHLLGLTGDRP